MFLLIYLIKINQITILEDNNMNNLTKILQKSCNNLALILQKSCNNLTRRTTRQQSCNNRATVVQQSCNLLATIMQQLCKDFTRRATSKQKLKRSKGNKKKVTKVICMVFDLAGNGSSGWGCRIDCDFLSQLLLLMLPS